MIPTIVWVLPRPRKNKYKGGFPLHFEKKLWRELGYPKKVLHPFGGMAEIGERVDINPNIKPDYVGDAHNLNIKDNQYDLVVLDPPYNDEQAQKLYRTPKLRYKIYINEAVRVCKSGGFIAMYHWVMTPRPKGTKYYMRIVILTRVWHRPRVCCVFQKEI
jgi:ubiquinone/menaquinone biosynthesis C-methylase UbiE